EGFSQEKIVNKIQSMLKIYLELDNVSLLFGSGTSIHLGAVAIRNFPLEVETYIKEQDATIAGINDHFIFVIKQLQGDLLNKGKANLIEGTQTFEDERKWKFKIVDEIVRDNDSNEIVIEYEKVLNYLIALDYIFHEDKSKQRTDK